MNFMDDSAKCIRFSISFVFDSYLVPPRLHLIRSRSCREYVRSVDIGSSLSDSFRMNGVFATSSLLAPPYTIICRSNAKSLTSLKIHLPVSRVTVNTPRQYISLAVLSGSNCATDSGVLDKLSIGALR